MCKGSSCTVSECIFSLNKIFQQEKFAFVYCWEPGWGTPPVAKVMRKEARHTQGRDRASGDPLLPSIYPQTRVCLLYCVMLSTYSSNINRGLFPHHLFLEKVNLELFDNKSPGHNKSVLIQKPLWWLSSPPDRFIQTLTATHVMVYSFLTVRGIGSLKHPRNIGASEESKSLE